MDASCLKSLGIRVLILSRGRSASIRKNTASLFPEYIDVLVPESEAEEYKSAIPNPVITVPDDVCGLGALRNWVLDSFNEETVIMVDDDIRYFYRLTGEKTERVDDPEEVIEVICNTAIMARDAGAWFFGFSQTDIRKYNGYDPFSMCMWVGCIVGVIGRHLRFRDDKFKVDIDFTLQNLLVNRIVWVDTRYYASQSRDNNSGGNAQFRTSAQFEQSIDSLKKKWGSCLIVRNRKNQPTIRMKVSRKQRLTYE